MATPEISQIAKDFIAIFYIIRENMWAFSYYIKRTDIL